MTREPNTASRNRPRWLPHSLRRQLLLGVLAVASVVLVTVGIVTVLSLRGYVTAMSDADVAESLDALSNSYTRYRNGEHTSAHLPIHAFWLNQIEIYLSRLPRRRLIDTQDRYLMDNHDYSPITPKAAVGQRGTGWGRSVTVTNKWLSDPQ